MGYRLFIDDLRNPGSPDWVIARSSYAAINILETQGCPVEISFDHDLGGDDTTMPVVRRLIDLDLDSDGQYIPADFHFIVHSANPVGAENIRELLSRYLVFRISPCG
ncbi:cyclic-phosphate processing receiver domain-containing protein [Paraburkholderia guartelaensis]|uniref:cyclic-phosphate processing receiver domain-containing protein n=1 Tax=Paraburkholderia guartelaensis TaxID=2546446 RepID=UPI002AB7188A|nr:cyclic-phosphate processing receiver domain-containing protein [Paraburkholderia guartelaensis]